MNPHRGAFRWRDYRTASGRSPVGEFLRDLDDIDAAEVAAAMKDVANTGLVAARKLRGDIWEVRAPGRNVTYRVLFATEGSRGHILLALEAFKKKTQKTPPTVIERAESRLRDWRGRGGA